MNNIAINTGTIAKSRIKEYKNINEWWVNKLLIKLPSELSGSIN